MRLTKAQDELEYASQFDLVVVNDDFDEALQKVNNEINSFIADKNG